MTSASLSRGRDHRQLVLLTFLTKILSLLFPARKAPQSILSLLKFWRLIQETVRQGNEIKAKIILSTVAECTPSPPAQLTWQHRITHRYKPSPPRPSSGLPGPLSPPHLLCLGQVTPHSIKDLAQPIPQCFSSSSIALFHHQFEFSTLYGGTARGRTEVTVPAEPRR